MADHILPEGTVLKDRYRIVRQLGEGGMGVVYEAHDVTLSRPVAVKVLNPALASRKVTRSRFENEAKAMAQIKSEHIVEVHDTGRVGKAMPSMKDAPFMVMEFLNGRDLANLLARRHVLSSTEAVGYVLEALLALAQAHSYGIVHRDLKPANLFLAKQPDGRRVIKVLDFGISKLSGELGSDHRLTSDSQVLGSPAYMAPEQLRHSNKVDVRADIWSLGVILYELMTGYLPFDGATTGALFAAIIEKTPQPMQRFVPDFSPELERVVLRCLAKNPESRWLDVVELSDALMPFGPPTAEDSAARIKRLASQPGIQTEESTSPSFLPPPGSIRNPPTDRTMMVDSDEATREPANVDSDIPLPISSRLGIGLTRTPARIGMTLGALLVVGLALGAGSAIAVGRWGSSANMAPPRPTLEPQPVPTPAVTTATTAAAPTATANTTAMGAPTTVVTAAPTATTAPSAITNAGKPRGTPVTPVKPVPTAKNTNGFVHERE